MYLPNFLNDVDTLPYSANLTLQRTNVGQASDSPIDINHDGSIKILPFSFDDPYEASFSILEKQLAAHLDAGWFVLNISAVAASDSLDGRHWGKGMVILKRLKNQQLCIVSDEQSYQVKVQPIVLHDAYADTLSQGEVWLDYYLNRHWAILDVVTVAGSAEMPSQRWAISLVVLGRYGDTDHTLPEVEWCSIHHDGEVCKQDANCLWCNY